MPSYYDSTKAKPGLAEIKYQAGGKVKKGKVKKGKVKKGKVKKEGEWKPYSLVVKEKDESGEVTTKMIPYGSPKKMSKGGKLKVTGMGAATRGGNFIRNG